MLPNPEPYGNRMDEYEAKRERERQAREEKNRLGKQKFGTKFALECMEEEEEMYQTELRWAGYVTKLENGENVEYENKPGSVWLRPTPENIKYCADYKAFYHNLAVKYNGHVAWGAEWAGLDGDWIAENRAKYRKAESKYQLVLVNAGEKSVEAIEAKKERDSTLLDIEKDKIKKIGLPPELTPDNCKLMLATNKSQSAVSFLSKDLFGKERMTAEDLFALLSDPFGVIHGKHSEISCPADFEKSAQNKQLKRKLFLVVHSDKNTPELKPVCDFAIKILQPVD
ncbi:hypothetical protein FACS189472_03300 [Alphaproteobacteria bacterium]|nr:hypothetical protein FACS189472_03300 [Alphaproteobacteria bacterium]